MAVDITEGRGDVVLSTELGPEAEDTVLGAAVLAGVGLGGKVESSAEIRREAVSCGSRSITQGLSCG